MLEPILIIFFINMDVRVNLHTSTNLTGPEVNEHVSLQ